jgi:ABC-type uncharacterized transport system permease subunit
MGNQNMRKQKGGIVSEIETSVRLSAHYTILFKTALQLITVRIQTTIHISEIMSDIHKINIRTTAGHRVTH